MSTGGDGILTITGFARFEKMNSAYDRVIRDNVRLKDELRKVQQQSRATDKGQEDMADKMLKTVGKVAAGWLSVRTAVELSTRAIEKQIELGNRATGLTASLAFANVDLMAAMGPSATSAQRQRMIAQAQNMGARMPIGQTAAVQSAAEIMGATTEGPGGMEARMRSVLNVLRLSEPFFRSQKRLPELGTFGGAALDLARGVPGMTEEASVNVMLNTLAQSRVTSVDKLANIIGGVVTGQVFRPKADPMQNTLQMIGIATAMGGRLGESEGRMQGYAAAALTGVVSEQAPQFDKLPIADALKEIRKDPKLVAKIKDKLQGYLVTKGAQAELLTPESQTAIMEAAITPLLYPKNEEMRALMRDIEGGTLEQKQTFGLMGSASEQEATLRKRFSNAGIIRAHLFGGEVEGRQVTGTIDSMIREGPQGIVDYLSSWAARASFEGMMAMGYDPKRAARIALSRMEFQPDREQDRMAANLLDKLDKLPDKETAEEIGRTTANAQNAAAAAAQRHAQQE